LVAGIAVTLCCAAGNATGTNCELTKEIDMNWDRIEGNWKQAKGKVKEQWGKLTDDYLNKIAGKRDQLVGKIQESYGIGKEDAERQVKDWEARNEALFNDVRKH
jgi:uncharacterized protein YjbJ (UPF0337 family)